MGHLERVAKEKSELDEKITKLGKFIFDENETYESLSKIEKVLLAQQLALMQGYSLILAQRLGD